MVVSKRLHAAFLQSLFQKASEKTHRTKHSKHLQNCTIQKTYFPAPPTQPTRPAKKTCQTGALQATPLRTKKWTNVVWSMQCLRCSHQHQQVACCSSLVTDHAIFAIVCSRDESKIHCSENPWFHPFQNHPHPNFQQRNITFVHDWWEEATPLGHTGNEVNLYDRHFSRGGYVYRY